MSRIVVGVMGPGDGAVEDDRTLAYELGGLIAQEGWVLLTGGWRTGVMDAASRGAKMAGGLVVGILPTAETEGMSEAVDIAVLTGMREGRNLINVLSSRVLFFVGMSAGTASELALALKAGRPVVLVRQAEDVVRTFTEIAGSRIETADDAASGIESAKRILASTMPPPPRDGAADPPP